MKNKRLLDAFLGFELFAKSKNVSYDSPRAKARVAYAAAFTEYGVGDLYAERSREYQGKFVPFSHGR